jgi:polygalacturonase
MPNRFSTLLLLLIAAAPAPKRFIISDFGAVGDAKTVNTAAIQTEIDSISSSGGGTLVVPQGTFLSGALFFKPGVDLEIEKDGILKGTVNQADYPLVQTRWEGVEGMHTSAFLNFDHLKGVAVSGEGMVDGSGDLWSPGGRGARRRGPATGPTTQQFARGRGGARGIGGPGTTRPGFNFQQVGRPRLICFSNCDGVSISGLHLKNQAIWCLHLLYSHNVTVDGLDILATMYIPSSDGIDVDSSQDVLIKHCTINCYDDNIAIKSGKDDDGRRVNRPTENITIEDCNIGIGAGIAMGSEVTGSIRHVLVQNCVFNGSDAAARFKSQPSRGGEITDIVYRNITLKNVGRAVEALMDWDMRLSRADQTIKLTDLHDVRLMNFTGTARTAGVIHGLPAGPVRDLTFDNCVFTAGRGLQIDNAIHIDTSGLKLTVSQGPAIMNGPQTRPINQGF